MGFGPVTIVLCNGPCTQTYDELYPQLEKEAELEVGHAEMLPVGCWGSMYAEHVCTPSPGP